MTVHLVGAGPGDPGLITVKGIELLRECDVVVYDRLVAPELVDEAPADALRIARDDLTQEAVNAVLVAHGRRGDRVVRLKGGDPFLFGRGGEEGVALAEAGVPFEVVPGVSALASVPSAAGIPITHRGVSAQVTIASGRSGDGTDLDWPALAAAPGTLVLFMAFARLAEIADRLIEHGREPGTPAAVIASGTTDEQRVVTAPLERIAVAAAELASPALIVIGDVVSLRERLHAPHATLA